MQALQNLCEQAWISTGESIGSFKQMLQPSLTPCRGARPVAKKAARFGRGIVLFGGWNAGGWGAARAREVVFFFFFFLLLRCFGLREEPEQIDSVMALVYMDLQPSVMSSLFVWLKAVVSSINGIDNRIFRGLVSHNSLSVNDGKTHSLFFP